jgi:chemotaxis response regulator CheB
MPLRVLVADDNEVVRSSIVGILKQNPDVEIVGESINYAQTLELTAVLKPDVLLLDLLMPDEEAFTQEAIKLHLLHNAGCILANSRLERFGCAATGRKSWCEGAP